MALTYDQHKAAIDAAYPTPPIDWARQDDHVTFDHHEVATVALTFNARDHHYLGSHYQEGGLEVWKIRRVMADGGRVPAGGVQSSWDDAKTAFVTYWEDHCETQRGLLAASAYGKDVVDDQPGDTPTVRMTFLHLGAPAQNTIPLNPGFIDSRFEYAAETTIQTVTLTATVPLGASVRWLYEHVITIGQAVTIDLHQGGKPGQHHRPPSPVTGPATTPSLSPTLKVCYHGIVG